MSTLYDEDGIDGPFERGLKTPIKLATAAHPTIEHVQCLGRAYETTLWRLESVVEFFLEGRASESELREAVERSGKARCEWVAAVEAMGGRS